MNSQDQLSCEVLCMNLVVSIFFLCSRPVWGRFPCWLVFCRWVVQTTNYFFLRFSDVPLSIFHSPPLPSSEEQANGSAFWQFRGILPGCDARWAFLWMDWCLFCLRSLRQQKSNANQPTNQSPPRSQWFIGPWNLAGYFSGGVKLGGENKNQTLLLGDESGWISIIIAEYISRRDGTPSLRVAFCTFFFPRNVSTICLRDS